MSVKASIAKSVVKDAIVIPQNSDKDVVITDEDTLLSDQGATAKENIED